MGEIWIEHLGSYNLDSGRKVLETIVLDHDRMSRDIPTLWLERKRFMFGC